MFFRLLIVFVLKTMTRRIFFSPLLGYRRRQLGHHSSLRRISQSVHIDRYTNHVDQKDGLSYKQNKTTDTHKRERTTIDTSMKRVIYLWPLYLSFVFSDLSTCNLHLSLIYLCIYTVDRWILWSWQSLTAGCLWTQGTKKSFLSTSPCTDIYRYPTETPYRCTQVVYECPRTAFPVGDIREDQKVYDHHGVQMYTVYVYRVSAVLFDRPESPVHALELPSKSPTTTRVSVVSIRYARYPYKRRETYRCTYHDTCTNIYRHTSTHR